MLRLNPSSLSAVLGKQLLEAAHLRPGFEQQLLPTMAGRLLDPSLQRANSGSIGLGSAITLFLAAYKRSPRMIGEVCTYIGNSAVAMALGAGLTGQLVTCDLHPCTQAPLAGLKLPQGSGAHVVQGSSTQMFQAIVGKQSKLDMLHLDCRRSPTACAASLR